MDRNPPWLGIFEVLDGDGKLASSQGLPLRQVEADGFEVGAHLRYVGETGLDDAALDAFARELPLNTVRLSDLASVPAALGWFETPHGVHTPAALFHDYLLQNPTEIGPADADLVFRNMLKALGVPTVKRYLMWTGVALRTRWETSRASLIAWVALSIAGLVAFFLALVGVDLPDWTGGRWVVLVVAGLAPLPASALWGKEQVAALVAAAMAIWILPAAVLALFALAAYGAIEWFVGQLRG